MPTTSFLQTFDSFLAEGRFENEKCGSLTAALDMTVSLSSYIFLLLAYQTGARRRGTAF